MRLLVRAKMIDNLDVAPVYRIIIEGHDCGTITPDFRYVENGQVVVEDVKPDNWKAMEKRGGAVVHLFRLQCKIMKAIYGVEVRVV